MTIPTIEITDLPCPECGKQGATRGGKGMCFICAAKSLGRLDMKFGKEDKPMEIKEEIKKPKLPEIPVCTKCGKNSAVMLKDGSRPVTGLCAECSGAVSRQGKAKMKALRAGESTEHFLFINIKDYPDIYGYLEKSGRLNIRSLEHQALAYIIKGLQADGFDLSERP